MSILLLKTREGIKRKNECIVIKDKRRHKEKE